VIRALAGSLPVRVVVTVAIFVLLGRSLDFAESGRALLRVDPRALVAVAVLVALDRCVMIWRWVLLLRATGSPVTAREAARIFLVSSFVGSFLPAGVGADSARAWQLSRHTARGSEAVASVAVDRVLGVVSIVALGALGAVTAVNLIPPGERGLLIAGAAALATAGVALLWFDRLFRLVPHGLRGGAAGRTLLGFADAMAAYRRRPKVLAAVLGLSFGVQVLRVLQASWLGAGLGILVPFAYYLAVMPVGLLMLLLPVSVSGFGLPQALIVWLLRPMGVPEETAFALSTLIVLSGLAANLPGAWLFMRQRTGRSSPSGPSRVDGGTEI
jgi:glycosyltransferase 2 family protein